MYALPARICSYAYLKHYDVANHVLSRVWGGKYHVGGHVNRLSDKGKWAKMHGGAPAKPVITTEEIALFKEIRKDYLSASSDGLVLMTKRMVDDWNKRSEMQHKAGENITIFPKSAWHLDQYDRHFVVSEQLQGVVDEYNHTHPMHAAHVQQVHRTVTCPTPTAPLLQPVFPGPAYAYPMPQNCGTTSTWSPHQVQYSSGAAAPSQPQQRAEPNPRRQAAHANKPKICSTCKRRKINATGHYKGECLSHLPSDEWPPSIRPSSSSNP